MTAQAHLLFFQFIVPSMALKVIDRAIQSFGAEGVSQDQNLAHSWAGLRTLRIADVRFVTSCNQRINNEPIVPGSRCGVLKYKFLQRKTSQPLTREGGKDERKREGHFGAQWNDLVCQCSQCGCCKESFIAVDNLKFKLWMGRIRSICTHLKFPHSLLEFKF
jgi:hypothetical protein